MSKSVVPFNMIDVDVTQQIRQVRTILHELQSTFANQDGHTHIENMERDLSLLMKKSC